MKGLKIILAVTLAILLGTATATAQTIKIPGTKVSFSFPDGGWKYLSTSKVSDNISVYIYSYSKDVVKDDNGDTVIPFMRIYVQKNYKGSVYDLAMNRFASQPFQSFDEYPFLDGIGYWGGYTSDEDGKDYFFQMVYLKDQNSAIEIRLETTRGSYDSFEKGFKAILNSIKKQ